MRRYFLLCLVWVAIVLLTGLPTSHAREIHRRQAATSSDTGLPTLTSDNGGNPTNTAAAPSSSDAGESSAASSGNSASKSAPAASGGAILSNSSIASTTATPSSTRSYPTSVTATASAGNSTASQSHTKGDQLPLKPHITPAFSIGGVVLILTGVTYALVGVKNQWVHTFLSAAYLTSLSITVLIVYVMSPPISEAIEGAYFVGIFMTGLIFGAGALIFKEVTEGLGCLLGGFCLSMWFLALKDGGLMTSDTGKGIFIGVFCVVVWSLSFSHYTRVYGLIGSTAFSGATSFVLGIDCFSRAGLKEFWVYIWDLNDNIFPLGTTTYPITRGIRVETIVIVLGTLVGVMSQIKLWKIVRAKQRKRDEAKKEDTRRKEVVEEALGRHIERQNDKDRANWERQYGDRLQAKRSTILWSEAHPDKSYTHISSQETRKPARSSSSESVEMTAIGSKRALSSYSAKNKRTSAINVDVILEEQEEGQPRTSMERQKALTALEREKSSESIPSVKGPRTLDETPEIVPLPFKVPTGDNNSKSDLASSAANGDPNLLQEPTRASRRRSLQSLLSLSPRLSTEAVPTSESQEALMLPSPLHSRPSSIAATLDEDNDRAALYNLNRVPSNEPQTPKIVISPAASNEDLKDSRGPANLDADIREVPPSPPALSVNFDFDDPEELTRPAEPPSVNKLEAPGIDKRLSKETKASTGSDGTAKRSSDTYTQSHISTGPSSTADGLTKGALNQVPSQLSNVVMSYRTNEWAKHIATADAPVFDEPEEIEGSDIEPATQLAPHSPTSPTSSSEKTNSSKTLATLSKPPQPHVVLSTLEGNVTANVKPPKRSASDTQISQAMTSTPLMSPLTQSPKIGADADGDLATAPPARSISVQSSRPALTKGKRSSLSTNVKQSLAATPIDENEPTVFAPAAAPIRRRSVGMPNRVASASSLAGLNMTGVTRPSMKAGTNLMHRSNSYTSLAEIQEVPRSSSVMSHRPAIRSETRLESYDSRQPHRSSSFLHNAPAMRSETRLDSYDSRQPTRRDMSSDANRRETLLAEWRMSQQQGTTVNNIPKQQVDTRRAQMLLDKEHKKLIEDQQRTAQEQKQHVIDQVMRRPDMQGLHREAMRKMQAKTKV